MSDKQSPTYLAYLIRLWHEEGVGWRATVEDPHTGDKKAFSNLDALLSFLREQTEIDSEQPNS